jgi:4-amino-4-deoxy-L-arabinose transferase-like glycosyltransferase
MFGPGLRTGLGRLRRRPLAWWTAGVVLFGLTLILLTFRDYGINWDENVQARYGEAVLSYFRSGFSDLRHKETGDLRYYGPLFELVAALLPGTSVEDRFVGRHLFIALTALLGVVAVIRIASQTSGAWAAVVATLALCTMPRFYGHAFINSKDIPFACALAWCVLAIIRYWNQATPRLRHVLALGASAGVTIAMRPAGLPVIAVLFLVGAAYKAATVPGKQWALSALGRRLRDGMGALAIAWFLMVAFWPYAHENPLLNPLRAVAYGSSFPIEYKVLFEGLTYSSLELPRTYLIKYLVIATPIPTLVVATAGLVALALGWWRSRKSNWGLAVLLVLAWLLAPPALFAILRPNVYDGMRHFLFLLPALALVAGMGTQQILTWVRGKRARAAVIGCILALVTTPALALFRLHPYQMTFFNSLVGGLEGANGNYETDYWLLSYKEAAAWINERVRADPTSTPTVLVAANGVSKHCASAFLDPNVPTRLVFRSGQPDSLPEGVDYYLATTRFGFDRNYLYAPVVHTVSRSGAVFSVIRARPTLD